MARTLTLPQQRIIRHVGRRGSGAWTSLIELDCTRLLEEDDVVVVPSLVEEGYLEHCVAFAGVCLTPRGERALERIGKWAPVADV